MSEQIKPPDFSEWTTPRLKFLLEEYRADLSSCRVLLGKQHAETVNYERWVRALEEELGRRNA
jgi:hypothetical protein